jgi:hypothetical protein
VTEGEQRSAIRMLMTAWADGVDTTEAEDEFAREWGHPVETVREAGRRFRARQDDLSNPWNRLPPPAGLAPGQTRHVVMGRVTIDEDGYELYCLTCGWQDWAEDAEGRMAAVQHHHTEMEEA